MGLCRHSEISVANMIFTSLSIEMKAAFRGQITVVLGLCSVLIYVFKALQGCLLKY